MGKSSKSKIRRIEVRRKESKSSEPLLRRFFQKVRLSAIVLWVGFSALAVAVVLYGEKPFPYYVGQEIRGPIFARVPFDIPDEERTRLSEQNAREQTPNFYYVNEDLIKRIRGAIGNLYNVAQTYPTYEAYEEARPESEEGAPEDPRWRLSQEGFESLRHLVVQGDTESFNKWVDQLVENLRRERIVHTDDDEKRKIPLSTNRAVIRGAAATSNDEPGPTEFDIVVDKLSLNYFNEGNLKYIQWASRSLAETFPPLIRDNVRQILLSALKEEPLLRFDLKRTLAEMEAEAKTRQEVKEAYPINAILAQERTTTSATGTSEGLPDGIYYLSEDQVKRLKYEHAAYQELLKLPLAMLEGDNGQIDKDRRSLALSLRRQHLHRRVGLGALAWLVSLGMVIYCGMFQPRVLTNPLRGLSIALLFLLMMATSRGLLLSDIAIRWPYVAVAPVVIAAAILTMAYSQRFAIGMTAALILFIVLGTRGGIGLLLVLAAVMLVAVYQLREIRSRHELFSTGILNALTGYLVALLVELVGGSSFRIAALQAWVAAGAAFGAVALFFIILSPIERVFKVATNWTLLELLDTSRRLLVRLAQEAPGTYNHSLVLSNMAETACEAIGANSLLAKVGAMYHDIGKIQKAEYFAENQEAQINRHDNLAPTMSLLVIIGHVKDGVELAKEYGLPPSVIRFIEEHHGTTVVKYFHHVASELQKASGYGRGEVSDTEFRYPGPKPQSKETAVLMLCDGVEGAVRALQEPTAGRIENVVHSVLMDRLTDGQFDNCDITLRELHLVEESLVKTLCRFYHGRVTYPRPVTA